MKKRLLYGLIFTIILATLMPFSASAATVGQQLPTEEPGWHRIDDTDRNILYYGNFAHHTLSGNYANTETYFTSASSSNSIHFKFRGTKLRIISNKYTIYPKPTTITIDGSSETYSTYDTKLTRMVLVYEKNGLTEGDHDVIITFDPTATYGQLDAIDIDANGSLLDINQPNNLSAETVSQGIALNWDSVPDASSYNVKRATASGGPYTTIASVTAGTYYTDTNVTSGTTYYYVITSFVNGNESSASNEAYATPQAPENDRVLLTITLISGIEKEYDLSITEVNDFIAWYEEKASGTGTASYAIDKHDNNKGPYKSRKDYMIFDKIMTFEVSEYTPVQ
ncbi:fibronectin type III domain-containing protein [Paenibacillus chartarius]|uniref:Fibronectin type III domain-containing protein n=1 Tax=Paenibacillus chartarius TaxID=747481 RepID=A0ABV6DKJ7_9BACL